VVVYVGDEFPVLARMLEAAHDGAEDGETVPMYMVPFISVAAPVLCCVSGPVNESVDEVE
jgi:hypothetical protein